MKKIIFHIDVNNAFLSWTAVDLLEHGYKIDIRNEYAVIGGNEETRSGIVLAKSTPAKKLGVTSAETLYQARKKVPKLLVFPPNYELYKKMSNKLFSLLKEYTPDIEIASIDECYLDYGKVKLLYGDELEFAHMLKERIKKELKFTVNIGIAENKLCAKMASDFEKPDKIHTLFNDEIESKMYPLPIGDLLMIGKKTVPKFHEIGIYTIGDLANYDIKKIKRYFKNQAEHLINMARGIDYSVVNSEEFIPSSISHEITILKDSNDILEIKEVLFSLSDMVGKRLRYQDKYAKTISVILKDTNFRRFSHQKKLINGINTTNDIFKYACIIFDEFYDKRKVRLIGIRLDDFTDECTYQQSIFDNNNNKNDEILENIVDKINNKYGSSVVKKASLFKK